MKKIKYIFLLFLGLAVLISCKKEDTDPKLDMSATQAPVFIGPASGSTYVLTEEDALIDFETFVWTQTMYNLSGLQSTKYTIQIDFADSNWMNATDFANTTDPTVSYTPTVGAVNEKLMGIGATPEEARDFTFRVKSFLSTDVDYTDAYSDVITLNITPYESAAPPSKTIYLLGSGTTIGWDNENPWPMTEIDDGKYAIVETLTPASDAYIKFISVPTQWAPQWGTDASGTWDEGNLVYRPTEDEPDPDAIPVGDVEGNYYIEADTIGLKYRVLLTTGELFLVGGGTTVGWDNTAALAFTQDPDTLTKFSIVTDLLAEGGMKFLEIKGEWAPQWGSYDGTITGGTLSYRENETVADPPEIPVPGTAGTYKIVVDLRKMKYWFEAQ
jgi:hypothetical protein